MKRLAIPVLLAVFGLLGPGAVVAAAKQDRVMGRGSAEPETDIQVSAHSGPLGEHPHGRFSYSLFGREVGGEVTCMRVVGNTAVVGTLSPFAPNNGAFLRVTDNGDGREDLVFDLVLNIFGPPADDDGCAAAFAVPAVGNPVLEGDLKVVDAGS